MKQKVILIWSWQENLHTRVTGQWRQSVTAARREPLRCTDAITGEDGEQRWKGGNCADSLWETQFLPPVWACVAAVSALVSHLHTADHVKPSYLAASKNFASWMMTLLFSGCAGDCACHHFLFCLKDSEGNLYWFKHSPLMWLRHTPSVTRRFHSEHISRRKIQRGIKLRIKTSSLERAICTKQR